MLALRMRLRMGIGSDVDVYRKLERLITFGNEEEDEKGGKFAESIPPHSPFNPSAGLFSLFSPIPPHVNQPQSHQSTGGIPRKDIIEGVGFVEGFVGGLVCGKEGGGGGDGWIG